MKKRRLAERITALLLAFLLVMGEFAGTGLIVRAADPEVPGEENEGSGEYNPGGKPNVIWVKTSKGDKNLVTEGSIKEGDGEITYNSSSCTLTMKNFNITSCYVKSGTEAYGLYCDGRLNIVVEGDCKVSATAPSNATVIDGIHVDQELSIKSGATAPLSSLTVSMGGSSKGTATGIFGGYGITIGNGAAGTLSVYATASSAAQDSYGVRAGRGITMSSGTLKATGGKVTSNSRSSYGILSKDGTFSVSGTASITATGGSVGTSTAKSYGLYHAGDLKVSGGTLTLETASVSGDLYTESCALYITKSTIISGGTVSASAGTAGNKATSHGVNSTGKLTISGGTLKAGSGKAGGTYSIAVDAGTFAMSGGTLNATAGGADSESYGLRLTDKQERETKITSGTITAKAGSAKTSYGIKVNTYFTLTGGKCTAVGSSEAISAAKPNSSTKEVTIKAPVYEGGAYTDGSSRTILDYYMYGWKYAILDATRAVVLIDDWTWGNPANSPSVMNLDRYGDGKVTASFAYKAKTASDSAYSSTVPSAVGEYTVKASLSNGISATKNFKIKQRDLSAVTATVKAGTYSGNPQNAVFTLTYKDKTLKEGTDYKITEGKSATDVGNVSAKLSGMGNFTGTKTVKWSLIKATPDASYYAIDGNNLPVALKRDYNGKAQSVNAPELRTPYTGGGSVRIIYEKDSKQTDQAPATVGTYKLIMQVGAGSNFNASKDDIYAGTLEIEKAANPMSVRDTKAMTGRTLDLTTAVSGAIGELSFAISGTDRGCSISGSTLTTGTETGEITISVTAAGNENYKEVTKTFKVNIKEMKMETLDVTMPSGTYGDTLDGPKYTSQTGMSNLQIHYTGIDVYGTDYDKDEKPSNAGNYVVSVEFEAGETVYSGSAEFSIARKEITIAGVNAYDKTYNADINAELDWSSVVLNGVLDKDKTDLGCFVMGVFADPAVGNNKPITVTDVALESGMQEISENYYIDETKWPADIKGNILPLSVRVIALDQTVEAGKPVASMAELAEIETANAYEFIPSGHELSAVTIEGDFDNNKTKASGAKITDADGADVTSNYEINYVDGNLTVTPRNLEAALVEVDGSYTFNGKEITLDNSAVKVTLDGDELQNGTDYSISSYSDNIHAGTAKVIVTGKGAFTGEALGSFTIGSRELSAPEITVSTAIWDGSAQEPNVQVYDPEAGVVSPMEYNLLYSNNVKVGDNTATVTITDREGGDYIVSGSAAFSIKKAAMRTLETINRNISKDDKSPRISIASMLPADAGAATGYDLWEEAICNGVVLNDYLVNTKGEIELEIRSGVSSDWVMISCWIKGENYDVTFWVKLTLTSLKTPEYTAPTAAALSYTGSAQKLLIPGTVTKGGKFEYSEDMNDWSEEIPEGIEAGEYTVYYRLTSTSEYNGVEATPVYVRIRNAAYRLTVKDGEGSGDYEEGERVTISASAAPAGQVFDKWTSEDDVVFEDEGASTTSLTMPKKAVTVSATFKKDEKPQAVLKKAPVAKDLTYNWNSQVLVVAGSADGGDLYYAVGKSTKKAPAESSFSKTLPCGEDPGYYYVWYYVKGDSTHSSTAPECITAVIRDKNGELPDPSGEDDVSSDSPLNPTVIVDSFTIELHLVKGQKGTIDKSLWKSSKDCGFKSSGKQLSVSKKGVITAKKTTSEGEYVFLTSNSNGKSVKISIAQPGFGSKKLTMEAGESKSAGFTTGDSELGVYYYSPAPDVAVVDQSGNIKAVGKGTVTITAYVNGKAYNLKVKVKEDSTAVERTMHLIAGSKKTIKLKAVKKAEWQSSNPSVVEVLNAKKGKIKAVGTGKAELTAVSGGTTYHISVVVEDPSVNTAAISRKGKKGYSYTAEMSANSDIKLKFVSLDITEHPVIFKSSKPAVAYVDENGTIVALSKGKTKLSAKIDGKTVTISVNVR